MKEFVLDKAQKYLRKAGMEVALIERGVQSDSCNYSHGWVPTRCSIWTWLDLLPSGGYSIDTLRKLCGLSTVPRIHLRTCARCLASLNFERHILRSILYIGDCASYCFFPYYWLWQGYPKYPFTWISRLHQTLLLSIRSLQETMPQKLVAHTGMDALTCDRSLFVSLATQLYRCPQLCYAIQMIQEKSSFSSYRERRYGSEILMHNAQCLAGICILKRAAHL